MLFKLRHMLIINICDYLFCENTVVTGWRKRICLNNLSRIKSISIRNLVSGYDIYREEAFVFYLICNLAGIKIEYPEDLLVGKIIASFLV